MAAWSTTPTPRKPSPPSAAAGDPPCPKRGTPLLRVRLSRELDQAITRAAQRAGITRAEWVHQVITHAVRKAI